MTSTILVTGGTGTLGGHVLPLLGDAELRILSRHEREGAEYVTGDLVKGVGVEAAMDGAEVVLHLAGGAKGDDVAAANVAAAAAECGVRHLVHISVIGADRVPLGYLRSQLKAEQAIVDSGVPWTILRAAQFHDLVLMMMEKMTKMPVVPVPGGLRFQPVDSREVAERLVELAFERPAGRVADITGPKVYGMDELVRGYLEARGKRRPTMRVRVPGKAGRSYRAGENLTLDGALKGKRTWEEFLDEQVRETATGGRA
ncbi:SDR family oxidoreductase [Spirillospora sp. CA-294931]|uniref:SDR family oxidoreductase n=1 Tax=Spirillospora sp. CA-294931 TaxID=3240042 RepID=UPI003D944469